MPTYVVKIGEIHLRSEEPITAEQRKQAIQELQRRDNSQPIGLAAGLDMVVWSDKV